MKFKNKKSHVSYRKQGNIDILALYVKIDLDIVF